MFQIVREYEWVRGKVGDVWINRDKIYIYQKGVLYRFQNCGSKLRGAKVSSVMKHGKNMVNSQNTLKTVKKAEWLN